MVVAGVKAASGCARNGLAQGAAGPRGDHVMPTRLSPHFTLEELVHTNHRNIDNHPEDQTILANLRDTAERMEKVREALGGKVISVSSCYRCPELNIAVGSKTQRSAHCFGRAVDFNCYSFGTPLEVAKRIQESGIVYDQLIH